MYKLYGYVPELKLLKTSFDEELIIEEINKYIFTMKDIHFIIILQLNDRMIPYRSICSEEEFLEYIEEYRNNNIIKRKER